MLHKNFLLTSRHVSGICCPIGKNINSSKLLVMPKAQTITIASS